MFFFSLYNPTTLYILVECLGHSEICDMVNALLVCYASATVLITYFGICNKEGLA